MNSNSKPILVIGGGIGGMTAALEAAETGNKVILVEKDAYLGGRVVRMYRYFPKMCPPTCGFEINTRRIRQNPGITVHTLSVVEEIVSKGNNFRVSIRKKPRYVTGFQAVDKSVVEQMTSQRDNDFNYGMDQTKALYLPHNMAYPPLFVLDKDALSQADTDKLKQLSPQGMINLNMPEEEFDVEASAIIIATGWQPYDAGKLDNLGFGKFKNVITNVMMERLAANDGPTGGEIIRPSDGKKAENIAFVQCAGSRDENHLPYCSAVCCMGSLKQARYVREKSDSAKVTIFYIDIRTIGSEEKFYYDLLDDENVSFIKGKAAEVTEDSADHNLLVEVEDTISGSKLHKKFDMVVLAIGMVPNTAETKIPYEMTYDQYGFIDGSTSVDGIFAAGCAKRPCDVSRTTKDSTAAALKAVQWINRGE